MTNASSTAVAVKAGNVPQGGCESINAKALIERELMQRGVSGETDLYYELIRPYERAVFLAATSILGNEADGEDVAQEAMLKAFKNLARFRGESKLSTW